MASLASPSANPLVDTMPEKWEACIGIVEIGTSESQSACREESLRAPFTISASSASTKTVRGRACRAANSRRSLERESTHSFAVPKVREPQEILPASSKYPRFTEMASVASFVTDMRIKSFSYGYRDWSAVERTMTSARLASLPYGSRVRYPFRRVAITVRVTLLPETSTAGPRRLVVKLLVYVNGVTF